MSIEIKLPLKTEVIEEHARWVTDAAFMDGTIVVSMDVRRGPWRRWLGLPKGTKIRWADVRTVDIQELSSLAWPMVYRLTYGDGWYAGDGGEREYFGLQPFLHGIDLTRRCTAVTLRAGILLAVMAGVGLRSVAWLMNQLFHVDVSKSSLDRWIRECARQLPDSAGMAKALNALLPIKEANFDEIFAKGQRPKKCTLVLRDEHGRIFASREVEERNEASVTQFLADIKGYGIELSKFYVDGCQAYRSAILAVFPDAVIQYDFFHVIQAIWKKLRRSIVARRKTLKARGAASESPEYSKRLLRLAKRIWNNRSLLLKHDRNMSAKEQATLQELIEADTHLSAVRRFAEAVWGIFEDSLSEEDAQLALQKLKALPQVTPKSVFQKAVAFLESRFPDMIAYLRHPDVKRHSLAETGIRCLRRLERGHDGFRGADGFDRYLRIYQAIKYCGWTVHHCAPKFVPVQEAPS